MAEKTEDEFHEEFERIKNHTMGPIKLLVDSVSSPLFSSVVSHLFNSFRVKFHFFSTRFECVFQVAPSIWEHEDVKLGLLCQLFGGTDKNENLEDDGQTKGNENHTRFECEFESSSLVSSVFFSEV